MHTVHVLGAAGFIGQNLVATLEKQKEFAVRPYSRTVLDLCNWERTEAVVETFNAADSVVFCAAVGSDYPNRWECFEHNVAMVRNFVRAAESSSLRQIVFLSSVCVYGSARYPPALPISENTVPAPQCCYGVSKLVGEYLLASEIGKRCPVTVLRLPGVYGPGDAGKSVIGRLSRSLREGGAFLVTGDGNTKRDLVDVRDVCAAILHFLQHPYAGVLNIASGRSISINEIAAAIARVLGKKPEIQFLASDTARDFDLVFDPRRLRTVAPELTFRSLVQGIEEYLRTVSNREEL